MPPHHTFPRLPSQRAATYLELYRVSNIMALVRFGQWDSILAVPFKDDKELVFLGHTLFLHYARGIAYV